MSAARLVTVILVTDTVGEGVPGSPIQMRHQLFTRSGDLVATVTALSDQNQAFTDGMTRLDLEREDANG
jgi:hypothetical protein